MNNSEIIRQIEIVTNILSDPNSDCIVDSDINTYIRAKLYRHGYLMCNMVDMKFSITERGTKFLKEVKKAWIGEVIKEGVC